MIQEIHEENFSIEFLPFSRKEVSSLPRYAT